MDLRFSQFEVLTTAGSFFICLFFVCVFLEASDIEQELGTSAAEAVSQQNLFWASVTPSGQKIVLTGAAPDYNSRKRAGEIAAGHHQGLRCHFRQHPGTGRAANLIADDSQLGIFPGPAEHFADKATLAHAVNPSWAQNQIAATDLLYILVTGQLA